MIVLIIRNKVQISWLIFTEMSFFRVLIVDWDVHHGQGVQYCFEDDPRFGFLDIVKRLQKWFSGFSFELTAPLFP